MGGNKGVKFLIVLLVIGFLTYMAAYGLNIFGWQITGAEDIRFGIDIKGGVYAVLYPDVENPTKKELETARGIIEERLNNRGIFDREITTEYDNGRIIIAIPWGKGETDFNPQSTINDIGKTALLTFQEVNEDKKDENGNYLPTGKTIIQGTDVEDARVVTDQQTGEIQVALELTDEAAVKFEEGTERLTGKPMAIFMDDIYISAPIVSGKIPGGNAVITGRYTAKEAGKLAATIRSGALPFKLEAKQISSISPTLGENALRVTLNAGIISFLLVFLYMLLYYRLPGILANIALLGLVVIQLLVISWFGVSLTLPGLAGIILSIGMGVDANIIIFERIKEELKSGKTLRASIDVGFKRAFTAILDANITTLISAAVLYTFGTGPIQGFAVTLFLGVSLSFLTAVTVSRIMIRSLVDFDFARNKWLYGA